MQYSNGRGDMPQRVNSHGITEIPKFAQIKEYSLVPYDNSLGHFGDDAFDVIEYALGMEVSGRRLRTESGVGFMVVSPGIVRVNFWGDESPNTLHTTSYEFDRKTLDDIITIVQNPDTPRQVKESIGEFRLHRLPVEKAGICLSHEGVVIGHESHAWNDFLMSGRSDDDKIKYLHRFYEGVVGVPSDIL